MNRKVLLIEPAYRNKYPPMGLMKLATYFRIMGDDVSFFKGDLKVFAARQLCDEFMNRVKTPYLGKYAPLIVEHIRGGKFAPLEAIPNFRGSLHEEVLKEYRRRFSREDYPKYDIIGITTLFTFYWEKTIDTINFAKKFCADGGKVVVGGIAATILCDEIYKETGITPLVGLLDAPGVFDSDSKVIIDELPLDYSILEETDYTYPSRNAYFAYTTRGCPRKCAFCAVPTLEPKYIDYINLKPQIQITEERFGAMQHLLLLDNNVMASKRYYKIIDEIKECGFERGASYIPESEYEIALKNLREKHNERAYTKKLIRLYDRMAERMSEPEQAEFYLERERRGLLYDSVAASHEIINFDPIVRPLYDKLFKRIKRMRTVDFNQGIDARLVTDKKMKKLAEISICPLRIAFDHYSMKETYIKAVRLAAKHGIVYLSNYLLYNFEDRPDELYLRLKVNIELCEELGVNIYSFPMKYHPIDDPKYFDNRDYIGEFWNRKFIRSVQSVLNATKGKVGSRRAFFEEAFGADIEGFRKILWMPEAFIIHRFKYKDSKTAEWWEKFSSLNQEQAKRVKSLVANNRFSNTGYNTGDRDIDEVLDYYTYKPPVQ